MTTPVKRCSWATPGNDAYIRYHDEEWGVPVSDDRKLFEFLILEGAQAGLSWSTVLNKRDGYRKQFADFDPEKVARFTPKRLARILTDPGIIRNRLKVESTVLNARGFLAIQEQYGSFARYYWDYVDGTPVQYRRRNLKAVPARSKVSDMMSKDLKKRGFKFVGSTILYAHMQAMGMVNDHTVNCFRHAECAELGQRFRVA